jgi:hypothetical protein
LICSLVITSTALNKRMTSAPLTFQRQHLCWQ